MQFAFSTKILRLQPLFEAIDFVAKAGFRAVEIMADRPHAFPEDLTAPKIQSLNQFLQEHRLKVSSLYSSMVATLEDTHNPSWIEEDWKKRELRIRYTLDCLRLAAVMGIPHVTTLPGGPIPAGTTRFDAWRLFIANMHRVLPLARKLGVKLLIDPEPGLLIESSDSMLEFLKELDYDECLRVDFDVVHLYCAGEDPCQAWEKLRPYVAQVHLADAPADRSHCHVPLGEGVIDLGALLSSLQQSDFQGFVVIRPDCHEQNMEKIVYGSASYLEQAGFALRKTDHCPICSSLS